MKSVGFPCWSWISFSFHWRFNHPCNQEYWGSKGLSMIETKTPHHLTQMCRETNLDKGHHNSPTQIFMYFLNSVSLKHKTIMFVQGTNRWQVRLAYILSSDLKEPSKNPVFQHFRASPLSYWLALTLKHRAKQRGWTPWYPRFRWFYPTLLPRGGKPSNRGFVPWFEKKQPVLLAVGKKTYKNYIVPTNKKAMWFLYHGIITNFWQ